jgi:hypothetical protein
MAQRRGGGLAAAALVLIVALPLLLQPEAASAQDLDDVDNEETADIDPGFSGFWVDEEIQPALDAVLARDALSTSREVEEWQSIHDEKSGPDPGNAMLGGLRQFFRDLGRVISYVVEFGLWIGLGLLLLLVFAIRRYWLPYLMAGTRGSAPAGEAPVLLAGEAVSVQSLPADIPAEVATLWRGGARRQALSLLYRGSVYAAVTQHGVRLPPSATEGSCVTALDEQAEPDQAAYFRKVVDAWIRLAYGNREPEDDVLALCGEWSLFYRNVT